MQCCNSYQEIKTPEDLEEEVIFESIYEELLDEWDPDEAGNCSFNTFANNCRSQARRMFERYKMQELEEND